MANEAPDYLDAVRRLPCCACETRFGIQAHHAGERAMSRRAHDHTAIPLCVVCHTEWHSAAGFCKGWDRQRRREWSAVQIAETQRRLGVGEDGEARVVTMPEWM